MKYRSNRTAIKKLKLLECRQYNQLFGQILLFLLSRWYQIDDRLEICDCYSNFSFQDFRTCSPTAGIP